MPGKPDFDLDDAFGHTKFVPKAAFREDLRVRLQQRRSRRNVPGFASNGHRPSSIRQPSVVEYHTESGTLSKSRLIPMVAIGMVIVLVIVLGLAVLPDRTLIGGTKEPQPTATAESVATEAAPTSSPEPTETPQAEITPSPKEIIWTISGEPNHLALPSQITVDQEGNVYVVDGDFHRIQIFDRDGNTLRIMGGPEHGSSDGQFWFQVPPRDYGDVEVDQAGNMYVADHYNRIQIFDSNGTFLRKFGECCEGDGKFRNLLRIAVDNSGNIYTSDVYDHNLQRFDPDGNFVLRWEVPPCQPDGDSYALDVAADAEGNIYVANYQGNCIQRLDSQGNLLNQWGEAGDEIGQFNLSGGVTVDRQGNVYVSNFGNGQIQKFDAQGTLLAAWNGFDFPMGVAVDSEGNIYVVEHIKGVVTKFKPK